MGKTTIVFVQKQQKIRFFGTQKQKNGFFIKREG